MLTALERAANIANGFYDTDADLTETIHSAIIEHCNAEIEARRDLERQLEGVKAIGVHVVCTELRTDLRVWNPIRKRFATIAMVEEGPGAR